MGARRTSGTGRAGRGRAALGGLFVVMALVAGACSSSSSSSAGGGTTAATASQTPVDGGSIVIGVTTETGGWNPHYTPPAESASFILSSMLEPLATTGEDLSAQPFLATAWVANDTFDRWTVTLRQDVTFQNGEKFDAAAAKGSIDDGINGAVSGQAVKGLFKGVSVVDDHTLLIELTQPWAAFPNSFLDSQIPVMMAPASLAQPDHGTTHPIGTGPFVFDSWEPGTSIKVKKNPSYWQTGQPHLDRIEFKVIPDGASRSAALQTGDLNMMLTTNPKDATSLDGQYQVIKAWKTEPEMIATNTTPKLGDKTNPLANVHARKALAYATDRHAVAALVGEGVDSPTSPFSPDSPWGRPEDQNGYPEHDVDKARSEVAAYLQDTGESSLHVTLTCSGDVDTTRIAQLVQGQWQEAGITVDIEPVEASALIGRLITGNYEASILQIYNAPDPDQLHYFWSAATISGYGGININLTQYSNPQMEAAIEVGRVSGDTAKRKAAYDQVVDQLNSAATNIWLYWNPFSLVADNNIHGLEGARAVPFPYSNPKTWFGELWKG